MVRRHRHLHLKRRLQRARRDGDLLRHAFRRHPDRRVHPARQRALVARPQRQQHGRAVRRNARLPVDAQVDRAVTGPHQPHTVRLPRVPAMAGVHVQPGEGVELGGRPGKIREPVHPGAIVALNLQAQR